MTVPTILGVPRARPIVEMGLGVNWGPSGPAGVWDTSLWDDPDSLWARSTPYWVDVTCDVQEISTFTGRPLAGDEWEVGTATIVVQNNTGWADFPPTVDTDADTDDVAYQLAVRPGRPIRVSVSVDDVATVLWSGYVDQANPDYVAAAGDVVVLECIDAKGEAGRATIPAVDPAVPALPTVDTVTQRVNRILNAVGWRTGLPWRNLANVDLPLIATKLGRPAIDMLNLAAVSAGGAIWGDLDGGVQLVNRDWQLYTVGTPPDAVIGEYEPTLYVDLDDDPDDSHLIVDDPFDVDPDVTVGLYIFVGFGTYELVEDPQYSSLYALADIGPLTVCPSEWEMSFSRQDYATQVIVGTAGAPPRPPFTDVPGRDLIGLETFTRTDLETVNNTDLDTIGSRWLVIKGVSKAPRVAAVTIDAATADNTVDVITTADPRIPSRYVCKHKRADGTEVFNRQMFATSVEHEIAPDSWICRIGLDDAAVFAVGVSAGFWNPTTNPPGMWDETTWSRRAVISPAGA